jgi:predicted ATPase
VTPTDFAGRGAGPDEVVSTKSEHDDHSFDTPASVSLSPLIGRDAELRLLEDRWEQALEGQGQTVLIFGEAGLGKSRLVQTIARIIQESAGDASAGAHLPLMFEWRCAEHFQNSELYPVSSFMNRLLGFDANESPSVRFERLAQYLEGYGLNSPESVGLFAKLLFLPADERYLAAGLTPAREREETFRVLRQWIDACAAKRPALFIVEDLHWSDASTLEFLGQSIFSGERRGILTILTFRPEFKIPWPAAPHQTVLALNRLSRRQVTEWLRTGSSRTLPESLVTQIYQRTGGVPLLVEEFTRMVRESIAGGAACPSSGVTRTSAKEIPATTW